MGCETYDPSLPSVDHPGQPLDYVTGALILVCTIPFVFGNIVMILNRNYPPIRSKSVDLTVLSSLGGLIWVAATLVVNAHFGRRRHTVWSVCSLWSFWLQACFGFALWLNCLILRLLNLHFVLILKRAAIKYVVPALLLLLSPIIIFSIFASCFSASRFEPKNYTHPSDPSGEMIPMVPPGGEGPHEQGNCSVQRGWAIGLLVLTPLYFWVFIGLAISLRNIRPQYNEFRLIRNGGILSVFLYLLSLVTFQTRVYHEVTGRCFLSIAVSGSVFYYFWARNFEVVRNVLLDKEQYLTKFVAKMNAVPSSNQSRDPNSLETLLFDTRDEVMSILAEVHQMEQTLGMLQEQYQMEWLCSGGGTCNDPQRAFQQKNLKAEEP